jgi:hypothetical protein
MDLSKLSIGDKLAVVGAAIAIIAVFLPWYSWSAGSVFGVAGVSTSASLMDFSGGIAFLIIIASAAGIAAIVLRMMDVFDISEQGVPESLVVLIAAAVVGLFTLLRVASIPGGAGIVGYGRTWGLWVGLAAAILYVVGAFMKFQEER